MKSTKKELITFFLLAFGWMWLLNLPRVLATLGWLDIPGILSTILGYLAVFGPAIAAFILTGIRSGKLGIKSLWRHGWQIDFEKKWLLPAIFLVPISGLITWLILYMIDVPIQWQYGAPPALLFPIGLLIWLLNAYPEEYGWRGYALPRLMEKFSPLIASLILGALWGFWHLPLHFIPTTTQYVIPIWQYLLQTVVLSIIYTWLHKGTAGSVFIASLFHAFSNIAGAAIPYWTTAAGRWVSFSLLFIFAVLIVIFSPEFRSKEQTKMA
ncbi:MAG: CPBP family intramembrane metalloprotease [Gammaproteobacteria bacterium]|nr:CPBP family intramembrane metalloprotease [Gammaproteobacteria bacterium]NIQ75537.1 CPBP family intramembrane metalloprotease [Gammaproteobacteria bacterium]